MAVIKEIKNGSGGVIRIHDDYCKNNTPEDNQKIIDAETYEVAWSRKRKYVPKAISGINDCGVYLGSVSRDNSGYSKAYTKKQ